MSGAAAGIAADALLIGGASARASADGEPDADTGDWQPGDTDSARDAAGALGLAPLPASVVSQSSDDLENGYLGAVAGELAGWSEGDDADDLGDSLAGVVADGDLAGRLVIWQVCVIAGQAAMDYYLASNVAWLAWETEGDGKVCPLCQANAEASPVRAGTAFPSGDLCPPGHVGCRCAAVKGQSPSGVTGPDVTDDSGPADDAGDSGADEEPEEPDEGAGDSGGEPEGDGEDAEEAGEADAGDGDAEAAPEFAPLEFADRFEAQDWMAGHTPDLPPEQAEAVDWYTGPGAYEANAPLRAGEQLPADVAEQVANMDAAMSPLPADMLLARMVDMDAFAGVTDLTSLEGQVITDAAFMSTALGPAVGDAGTEVLMRIAAPEGTPGVITGTLSGAPSQREVVLARGTRLAVQSAVRNDQGVWEMRLVVVPGE